LIVKLWIKQTYRCAPVLFQEAINLKTAVAGSKMAQLAKITLFRFLNQLNNLLEKLSKLSL
jgi:hypothetical protein